MSSEACPLLWIAYIILFLGLKGWVKRKRTPRFQIACSSQKDDKDSHVSPNRSGQKTDWADDVENAAASVLTKACQRGGSPHVSQSPFKKDHMTSSPFQSRVSMVIISIFWFFFLSPCFMMSEYQLNQSFLFM